MKYFDESSSGRATQARLWLDGLHPPFPAWDVSRRASSVGRKGDSADNSRPSTGEGPGLLLTSQYAGQVIGPLMGGARCGHSIPHIPFGVLIEHLPETSWSAQAIKRLPLAGTLQATPQSNFPFFISHRIDCTTVTPGASRQSSLLSGSSQANPQFGVGMKLPVNALG